MFQCFPQTLKFYISGQICKVLSVIIWVRLAAISIFSAHRPRIFGQFSAPLRRSNNFSGRAQTFKGRNCRLVCQFANLKTAKDFFLWDHPSIFNENIYMAKSWQAHKIYFTWISAFPASDVIIGWSFLRKNKSWRWSEAKSVKPGGKSVDMASLTGN